MDFDAPYFILETAFHHEGDTDFLENLIDSYAVLEANAIKFHLLFDINDYMVNMHPAVETLEKISIKKENWERILKKVELQKKDIILLCNDIESLRWVNKIQNDYPIAALEIHSTGLNDIFLLNEATKFNKTIILGIGGSTFDEIHYAIDYLYKNNKRDILLIHGFQNYPTDYANINFNRMRFLKEAFDLPIGYADHTDPNDEKNIIISTLPIVLGYNIIEKHVTHVLGEKRIDSQAAVSINTMSEIINLGKNIAKTRGKYNFELSDAEKNYGNTGPMKKAIVARENIKAGDTITLEKIAFKRTESSSPLQQKDLNKILMCIATEDIRKDEILSFNNVTYEFKKENFEQFFLKNK